MLVEIVNEGIKNEGIIFLTKERDVKKYKINNEDTMTKMLRDLLDKIFNYNVLSENSHYILQVTNAREKDGVEDFNLVNFTIKEIKD